MAAQSRPLHAKKLKQAQKRRQQQRLEALANNSKNLLHKEQLAKEMLNQAVVIPQEIPIKEAIGEHGLMWPRTYLLDHPAVLMLDDWARNGCPADCGLDWATEQIVAAIKRGETPPPILTKQRHISKKRRRRRSRQDT